MWGPIGEECGGAWGDICGGPWLGCAEIGPGPDGGAMGVGGTLGGTVGGKMEGPFDGPLETRLTEPSPADDCRVVTGGPGGPGGGTGTAAVGITEFCS